ncbi:hypothetical protein Bca52824_049996 [Brassica carinata]|uniref:Uncharacterized protein n=1 Tax=Brassica carinata TaxID=52824 RepID=A0A8X7RM12_BRACI|nr:hypothetical protein Bca52824_049996 [Brassica carinata]
MSQEYDLGDGHYKRNLSPKWFCKTSSSSPPLVLHDHVKDYNTKSTFSDSSLLARSFHRQVFIEDRKKMSFAQPLGASSGVLLCRHISSSSGKPEESSIKIDALGDVVPDGSVEAVQAMVNNLIGWSLEMKYLYPPVYCVQCVIMAIHDFTGFNWSTSVVLTALLASGLMWPVKMRIQRQVWELKILRMSIQNVRRVMQTCDPKDLAENKKLEAELTVKFEKCDLSYMPLCFLDLLIPMACIQAINIMCVLDKVFENGGIWVGYLSTQDNMLPLLTALTFWFTSKVLTTSLTKILSRIKELPLYCIFFLVFQAAFKLYFPAVYFYLITYKLSPYTLHLRKDHGERDNCYEGVY